MRRFRLICGWCLVPVLKIWAIFRPWHSNCSAPSDAGHCVAPISVALCTPHKTLHRRTLLGCPVPGRYSFLSHGEITFTGHRDCPEDNFWLLYSSIQHLALSLGSAMLSSQRAVISGMLWVTWFFGEVSEGFSMLLLGTIVITFIPLVSCFHDWPGGSEHQLLPRLQSRFISCVTADKLLNISVSMSSLENQ